MSIDIQWDLLTTTDGDSDTATQFQQSLITLLNTQLAQAHRPSFIGPITVTSFDFGGHAPDLEIKDIRDVWRVFDQGDEEGDLVEEEKEREKEREARDKLKSEGLKSGLDGEKYELVDYYSPTEESSSYDSHIQHDIDERLENESLQRGRLLPGPAFDRPAVHRSTSSRSFIPYPFDHPAPTPYLPSTPGLNPSIFSHPLSRVGRRPMSTSQSIAGAGLGPSRLNRYFSPSSTPPSPPARPAGLPPKPPSAVPSLQLHLHLTHSSDLHLTLLTSLQVNYPSSLFMALPLKISITGFQLDAEIIMAYNGDKNRVHLTIVEDQSSPSPLSSSMEIGQRILSNLQIESEIGHADAHVLRNVGKVERFIVDVVRKTLVEELVFPNFHTVAL